MWIKKLTGGRGSVEPTRELYGSEVLDCVEEGSSGDEEDPFGEQTIVFWKIYEHEVSMRAEQRGEVTCRSRRSLQGRRATQTWLAGVTRVAPDTV